MSELAHSTDEEELPSLGGRKVVRVGNKVIKSGDDLRAAEVASLRFIAERTTIPVPKVHDVQFDSNGKLTAITMEYMPGKRLDRVWKHLAASQKLAVVEQLKGYVAELRALKGTYIGSVGGGKAVSTNRSKVEGGPFENEALFNEFLCANIGPGLPGIVTDIARDSLAAKGHEIVFTHADLAPHNILVDDRDGGLVTAVLDWDAAGWYPEHWEFVRALHMMKPLSDWSDHLRHVFPVLYYKEYLGHFFHKMVASY